MKINEKLKVSMESNGLSYVFLNEFFSKVISLKDYLEVFPTYRLISYCIK